MIKQYKFKTIVLCGFVLGIFLVIIWKVKTIPFSDFQIYYEKGLEILQRKSISNDYKYFQSPGYPFLLALVFYVFGSNSILLPQLLNAFILTFILGLSMRYPIASSHSAILIGCIMMAFNVNYFGMVSVLCTEIPYVLFLFIGILTFWLGTGARLNITFKKGGLYSWFLLLMSGVFLGTSQCIRPVTFPYFLIFSSFMILGSLYFNLKQDRGGRRKTCLFILKALGLTGVSFFAVALTFYFFSGYGFTFMPKQKGLWNLYVGLNIESKGWWNSKDSRLIWSIGSKYSWDANKINEEFKPIVFDRIKNNWTKSLKILPEKVYKLMNPTGIPYWAVERSALKNKNIVYSIANYLRFLNSLSFLMAIGFFLIFLWKREILQAEFVPFCVTGSSFVYMLLHGYFLEVQPRYSNHLWMLMFWCYPLFQQTVLDFARKIYGGGGKMRIVSFIMIGAGIIILLVSLLADFIGLGRYPGIGKNQAIGAIVGLLVLIAGIIFNRKYDNK